MTNQEKLEKYNANAAKIAVLKNKIANIESCEEILSTAVGTNGLKAKKYKTQYPFFKRTAGASGYVDTGSFYGLIVWNKKILQAPIHNTQLLGLLSQELTRTLQVLSLPQFQMAAPLQMQYIIGLRVKRAFFLQWAFQKILAHFLPGKYVPQYTLILLS